MFYILYLFLTISDIDERHSVRDYHASGYRGVLPSQTSTLPFSYGYERRGGGRGRDREGHGGTGRKREDEEEQRREGRTTHYLLGLQPLLQVQILVPRRCQ